jgi:hypothetical protein
MLSNLFRVLLYHRYSLNHKRVAPRQQLRPLFAYDVNEVCNETQRIANVRNEVLDIEDTELPRQERRVIIPSHHSLADKHGNWQRAVSANCGEDVGNSAGLPPFNLSDNQTPNFRVRLYRHRLLPRM